MEEKDLKEITERLDKLIRIVAFSSFSGLTMTEKINMLNQCGFKPVEIADVLGTTSNVVNVRLSEIRKKKR